MRFWLPFTALLALASNAAAEPVHYDLDSAQELLDDQWEHIESENASDVFEEGLFTISTETGGYNEWLLRSEVADSPWWSTIDPCVGWWIEVRVRVASSNDPSCSDGPGLWIHDRGGLIKLTFKPSAVRIWAGEVHLFPLADEGAFHTYRLESFGGNRTRLLVDGEEVFRHQNLRKGEGSKTLSFGNLGGCGGSVVSWDSLTYDTQPSRVPEDVTDEDGDGILDLVDNCSRDSNGDQTDSDLDCNGDLCDPCPQDPNDDSDGDGLCDSEDPCPTDPRNADEDGNGICDIDEPGPPCCPLPVPEPIQEPVVEPANEPAGEPEQVAAPVTEPVVEPEEVEQEPLQEPAPQEPSVEEPSSSQVRSSQSSEGCASVPGSADLPWGMVLVALLLGGWIRRSRSV